MDIWSCVFMCNTGILLLNFPRSVWWSLMSMFFTFWHWLSGLCMVRTNLSLLTISPSFPSLYCLTMLIVCGLKVYLASRLEGRLLARWRHRLRYREHSVVARAVYNRLGSAGSRNSRRLLVGWVSQWNIVSVPAVCVNTEARCCTRGQGWKFRENLDKSGNWKTVKEESATEQKKS